MPPTHLTQNHTGADHLQTLQFSSVQFSQSVVQCDDAAHAFHVGIAQKHEALIKVAHLLNFDHSSKTGLKHDGVAQNMRFVTLF